MQWYDRNGRRDLPWQRERDPYRIWVSEIMLQQTQVATVAPYFTRFVARFPDVGALSAASLDEVLHLWTGLGYYARARNMHRAARVICGEHGGVFPRDEESVYRLPGIGRSTAHAILAFAFDRRVPILDGNVKRVLTRHHRVHGWPGKAAVERELWRIADENTPPRRTGDYTQAIMDLGATVCVRRAPACKACPLAGTCAGLAAGEVSILPTRRPKRRRPTRSVAMILATDGTRVLLERRPTGGIWGGLWGLPEAELDAEVASTLLSRYGLRVRNAERWPTVRHGFTHFDLDILPVLATVDPTGGAIMENDDVVWYNPEEPDERGLAAPVKRLLDELR